MSTTIQANMIRLVVEQGYETQVYGYKAQVSTEISLLKQDNQCAGCRKDFLSETLDERVEASCSHFFHITCLIKGSASQDSCPLCASRVHIGQLEISPMAFSLRAQLQF